MEANFPAPLECLFRPRRYKILWGGRGAGRSWGVATALLLEGVKRPIRVLCARELQNSIAESVHKLLSDKIDDLNLNHFYTIQRDRIFGSNGTSFVFEGIKNNVNKIKSFEGLDYCWVEEANKVSKNSWEVLVPTVRKDGSEIWMTFNPELETDYTFKTYIKGNGAAGKKSVDTSDSFVRKMTWEDNPWFPAVLEAERLACKARDPDAYLNIWEGNCRHILEGAVYAKELRRAQEEGRICTVPYDPNWPVDTFWDLGKRAYTAIWFAQRIAMQYRILDYFQESLEDLPFYIKECQSRGYAYGTFYLPHDAKAKKLGTKLTIQEQLGKFYKTQITPNFSINDGINAARLIFPNCWFDEEKCEDGLNALRHYRYKVSSDLKPDGSAQLVNEPLHDWASDGADAFRYLAIDMQRYKNRISTSVDDRLRQHTEERIKSRHPTADFGRRLVNRLGWMN